MESHASHLKLEPVGPIRKNFPPVLVWLHCLHQYGYHTTFTVACTESGSKLCINIRSCVNCEILCNISKSQGLGNFSNS